MTQTRLGLCGLEAGDWIAILALKVQLTCAKETDENSALPDVVQLNRTTT